MSAPQNEGPSLDFKTVCADFQIFSKTLKIKGLLCENDSLLLMSDTNEHSVA